MFELKVLENDIFHMRFRPAVTRDEALEFLRVLKGLEARERRYAVIVETDGKSPLPTPERKQFAAWYRANKARLRRDCVGLARLAPDVSALERFSAKAFRLFVPVPYHVTSHPEDALRWARERLREG